MNYSHRFLIVPLLLLAFAVACGDDDDDDTENFATDPPAASEAVSPGSAGADGGDCPVVGEAPEVTMMQYDSAPEMTIDPAKEYIATIKTVRGDVTIKLRPDLAPEHVNSFVFLAREGFYKGTTFHRVLQGFMAQGGDPTGTGTGGPGYSVPAEFTAELSFQRGVLGMARSADPNSAGSQFFITTAPATHLDGQYTIFGEVLDGMEAVDCLTLRDPNANPNAPAGDAIISVEIAEN